jgi:hypothetical protein
MRKMLARVGVVGVVAVIGASSLPQAALAAGNSNTCQIRTCSVSAPNFPGGTLSVDADAGGTTGTATAFWAVTDSNSPVQCSATFPVRSGVTSWTCSGVARGTVSATLSGPAPLKIGLRW